MAAMALITDPDLVILDEPTTALDVTTQAQILELLSGLLHERGMALMLITHDLGVIAEMDDVVLVMYLGTIVEQGPVDAIFHDPKHPYTQALLRSMPSVTANARPRLATVRGSVPHPINRPGGCPFHQRCPNVIAGVCDRTIPAQRVVGPDHAVSCHLHVDDEGKRIDSSVAS